MSAIRKNPTEDFYRLSGNGLTKLMTDQSKFEKIVIVDCRSDTEYNHGHIRGAKHGNSDEKLQEIYQQNYTPKTCFVFHCEYSQVRGPRGLKRFLELNRKGNETPECYVLDGGYKAFFMQHQDYCEGHYRPENVTPMY